MDQPLKKKIVRKNSSVVCLGKFLASNKLSPSKKKIVKNSF
jgi:hypothetical protein